VMGGYSAAHRLGFSGPLAMVVAGLVIGTHGRRYAMSATTREHLDNFWELLDEILNAVLFVLIGLEVFVVVPQPKFLVAGALAIAIVLVARYLSALAPVRLLARPDDFPSEFVTVLTWGGLRGGISVALALSLPAWPDQPLVVTMTYCVVLFAILVQGTTIAPLVRRLGPAVAE
jgi:CPA1 family monovalent cation:H+ antiporter